MSSPSDYRYIRVSADPIINLGRYQTGVEKLWLDFQTSSQRSLRNRTLSKGEETSLISRFNNRHLPAYRGLVIAIEETDEPIGYGAFSQQGREAGYTSAYVEPSHRRQGVFGKITDEVILFAKEAGARKLDAIVTSKELSIQSLLRRGFQEAIPDPRRTVEGIPLRMRL